MWLWKRVVLTLTSSPFRSSRPLGVFMASLWGLSVLWQASLHNGQVKGPFLKEHLNGCIQKVLQPPIKMVTKGKCYWCQHSMLLPSRIICILYLGVCGSCVKVQSIVKQGTKPGLTIEAPDIMCHGTWTFPAKNPLNPTHSQAMFGLKWEWNGRI